MCIRDSLQRLPQVALSVLLLATGQIFERSMLCVCGELCSNNACDLNCVCSFRMSFLFVFVCLYISTIKLSILFLSLIHIQMCIRDRHNTASYSGCHGPKNTSPLVEDIYQSNHETIHRLNKWLLWLFLMILYRFCGTN